MPKERRKRISQPTPIGEIVKEIKENMTITENFDPQDGYPLIPPPNDWTDTRELLGKSLEDKMLGKGTGELPFARYRLPGYNSIAMNNCVHIKPIRSREMKTKNGIIIPDSVAGNDKNFAPLGRVMSISPNLLILTASENNPYPDFRTLNIKPGDLVYFNHLSGEGMRLSYKGKQTEVYSIFAINIFGLFDGNFDESEDDIETNSDNPNQFIE